MKCFEEINIYITLMVKIKFNLAMSLNNHVIHPTNIFYHLVSFLEARFFLVRMIGLGK